MGGGCPAPRLTVGTNLLHDVALVPDVEVGICLADRYTIQADWMYAWWSNRGRRLYWRVYGGDIGVTARIGKPDGINPLSGHHIGAYASIVTYDFQLGRSHTGVMGDKFNYAAGIYYRFSLPVARRLNIDFSLGVGYMWGRYIRQHLVDTHDVWISTHRRRWIGPTRAGISLTWLIGHGNVNATRSKKGGGR